MYTFPSNCTRFRRTGEEDCRVLVVIMVDRGYFVALYDGFHSQTNQMAFSEITYLGEAKRTRSLVTTGPKPYEPTVSWFGAVLFSFFARLIDVDGRFFL